MCTASLKILEPITNVKLSLTTLIPDQHHETTHDTDQHHEATHDPDQHHKDVTTAAETRGINQ